MLERVCSATGPAWDATGNLMAATGPYSEAGMLRDMWRIRNWCVATL